MMSLALTEVKCEAPLQLILQFYSLVFLNDLSFCSVCVSVALSCYGMADAQEVHHYEPAAREPR